MYVYNLANKGSNASFILMLALMCLFVISSVSCSMRVDKQLTQGVRFSEIISEQQSDSLFNDGVEDSDWYNADWKYRMKIIIDHSKVEDVDEPSITYADFPLLVSVNGLSNVKADGADIRFTLSDGISEIPREIESYLDDSLYAWVKVTLTKDSSDSSDDIIYMYYGNSEANEPAQNSDYGSQNVWDSRFKTVQHLQETKGGISAIKDSTSENNNGTDSGNPILGATGKIGSAIQFDGIDDYINYGAGTSLNITEDITLEAWVKKAPPTRKNIAEYEPMQGVLVQYSQDGFGIPIELIVEMSRDVRIVTIVKNAAERAEVAALYLNNGVNYAWDNSIFLIAPSNSIYTRDYGPWFIFDEADKHKIIDFNYLFRPMDNVIPKKYGSWLGIEVDLMDLNQFGGNYMTDGHGIGISTSLVEDDNLNKSTSEIDKKMRDYLGIDTYYRIEDALNSSSQHVDLWAKLLAPDKIMIINVPENHPQYTKLNMAAKWFQEIAVTSYGGHYSVYRVDSDPENGEAYVNSLILNDKVLLPFTGNKARDNAAKMAFENAMPGYKVLGFEASPGNEWLSDDALHCRVLGIPYNLPWDYDYIVSKGKDAWNFQMNRVGTSLYGYVSDNEIMTFTSQPSDWHYYALTFDGVDLKLFIDGLLRNTTRPEGAIRSNGTAVTIGGSEAKGYFGSTLNDGGYFSGIIDEVRLSNKSRSQEWITTSYNNQNAPYSFYSVGSVEVSEK